MIFDNSLNESYVGEVKPSPYPVGLEGALMHVYENERNYCEMMKAVGISEARYYAETGQDLFLNESGAFSGFLTKAKEFFKKVLEKIKSIFKALYAKIYSFVGDDKKFVKKYEKQLLRVNMQDFEFEGYEFPKSMNYNIKWDKVQEVERDLGRIKDLIIDRPSKKGTVDQNIGDIKADVDGFSGKATYADADEVTKQKEILRGSLIGAGPLDESEFRDECKDLLYGNDGEKTTLENISIRAQLQIITNAESNIKAAKKSEKECTKWLDDLIKKLDKLITEVGRDKNMGDQRANNKIKNINDTIDILRSVSNDVTIFSGLLVQAIKDANRQAKAICVKALTYKVKESANYGSGDSYSESSFDGDDLLGNVELL